MSSHAQRRTVLLALSRGLVGPRDVEELLRTPAPGSDRRKLEGWDEVLAALVELGKLDAGTVARLEEESASRAGAARSRPVAALSEAPRGVGSRRSAGHPRQRAGAANADGRDLEGSAWGGLTLLSPLGSGGMGEVYKAFDPALQRFVAVKILRSADPETVERFMREARAQARLDHPNICQVHEVGEVEGTPYISMQFIDGQTLDRAAGAMTLEHKVHVAQTVAEALHAAHRVGLIHRDIKPSNIMVERGGDGEWKPYVVDFGLVRDPEAEGLTLTGEVMGTPSYMAPEQARGQLERLDRRTDVYSLGCVLYELLAGLPPFVAPSGMDVLVKMLGEDPEPLRRHHPHVPHDLETITMKCLEKDPARRYDSARALAEDLGRFLDGDPIEARRASPFYRLAKRVRKHRVASALVALATVAVVVSATIAGTTLMRARGQAAAARRFGEEIKEIEGLVRTAAMLPLHDTSRELAMVQERLRGIRRQARELGAAATGPAEYALGRGALAMRRYGEARAHLEAAWRLGYREPEVAYALGLTFGNLYQRALEDAQRIALPELREARERQAEATFRAPALAYLKRAHGAVAETPDYPQGLIAFYEGRWSEALADARRAFAAAPWLYEAEKLAGDVLVAQGNGQQEHGDLRRADDSYRQAGEAYAAALTIARSDGALYESECSRWMHVMELDIDRGGGPSLAYARGLEACNRALQASPGDVPALIAETHLHWRYGAFLARAGRDAAPTLASAVAMGEKAVESGADDPEAHLELGLARWTAAELEAGRGEDPRAHLDGAIASFRRAIDIDPTEVLAYNGLGAANSVRADYESDHGRDPRPFLAGAMAAYRKALELKPDFVRALNNLGLAFQTQAEYELAHDLPAEASLASAADAFRRATALNPSFATAAANLGNTLWTRAELAISHGQDPSGALEEAISSLRRALEINPHYARALASLAGVHAIRAAWALDHDRQPEADIAAARDTLARSRKIDPDDMTGFLREGQVAMLSARWAAREGRSPLPDLDDAQTAIGEFVRASTQEPEGHVLLAEVHWRRGEWLVSQGRTAAEEVKAGLAEAGRALALSPSMADALALRGALRAVAAGQTHGTRRLALARQAVADLTEAGGRDAGVASKYRLALDRARRLAGS
jgi:tetratricopeptide (TPR) repeat protein